MNSRPLIDPYEAIKPAPTVIRDSDFSSRKSYHNSNSYDHNDVGMLASIASSNYSPSHHVVGPSPVRKGFLPTSSRSRESSYLAALREMPYKGRCTRLAFALSFVTRRNLVYHHVVTVLLQSSAVCVIGLLSNYEGYAALGLSTTVVSSLLIAEILQACLSLFCLLGVIMHIKDKQWQTIDLSSMWLVMTFVFAGFYMATAIGYDSYCKGSQPCHPELNHHHKILRLPDLTSNVSFSYPDVWMKDFSSNSSVHLIETETQPDRQMRLKSEPGIEGSMLLFARFWYFSVQLQTQVGIGDVIPICWLARGIALVQMIIGVLFSATLVSLTLDSFRQQRKNVKRHIRRDYAKSPAMVHSKEETIDEYIEKPHYTHRSSSISANHNPKLAKNGISTSPGARLPIDDEMRQSKGEVENFFQQQTHEYGSDMKNMPSIITVTSNSSSSECDYDDNCDDDLDEKLREASQAPSSWQIDEKRLASNSVHATYYKFKKSYGFGTRICGEKLSKAYSVRFVRRFLRKWLLLVTITIQFFHLLWLYIVDGSVFEKLKHGQTPDTLLAVVSMCVQLVMVATVVATALVYVRHSERITLNYLIQCFLSVCIHFCGIYVMIFLFQGPTAWPVLDYKDDHLHGDGSGLAYADGFWETGMRFMYLSVVIMTTTGCNSLSPKSGLAM